MNKFKMYFLVIGILIPFLALSANAQTVLKKSVIGSGSMVSAVDNANKTQMSGIFSQTAVGKLTMYGSSENGTVYLGFWGQAAPTTGIEVPHTNFEKVLTNYPNPVTSSTTFKFELPAASNVSIKVYDINSKLVKEVFNGYLNAGVQELYYDATDANGINLVSGSYMIELSANPYNMAGAGSFDPIHVRNIMVVSK